MACIFFLSHYISVIGVFFFILVTLHLCLLLIYRYLWNFQKWQILISVNRELDFLHFQRFVTRTPKPPLKKKFSSMEKVFKIHVPVDLNLQTFFSSIFICILGGICLSCLPLNCHYHQIGFALKQVVPVSYKYSSYAILGFICVWTKNNVKLPSFLLHFKSVHNLVLPFHGALCWRKKLDRLSWVI